LHLGLKVTDQEVSSLFNEALFHDLATEITFADARPLLAHYTSIAVVESILRNKEVWFSNPLLMNDHEEVRFGMLQGVDVFLDNAEMTNIFGPNREFYNYLCDQIVGYRNKYGEDDVIDTFVFSLSEINENESDGLLSMWRGYGGNGAGAAIVFDSAALNANEDSPFIIAKVDYGTTEARIQKLNALVKVLLEKLASNYVPKEQLHLVAHQFIERLKIFSLFTKHDGFSEEREWRVVYMPERDPIGYLKNMIGYSIGLNGIEPKLKFNIEKGSSAIGGSLTMAKIVSKIILGPTVSSPLAKASFLKMLSTVAPEMSDRLVVSSIPFRNRN
jgi:hypothetical protein